jgi:peptidoglycan hydrolase-like protein with peptidoglycan-binding domain
VRGIGWLFALIFGVVLVAAAMGSRDRVSQIRETTMASPVSPATTTAAARDIEIPERAVMRAWIAGAPQTDELQACLSALGYDVGPIDGIDGPKTTSALKAFVAGGEPSDERTRVCWRAIETRRAFDAIAVQTAPPAVAPAPTYLPASQQAATAARQTGPGAELPGLPAAGYGDVSNTTGLPRTQCVNGYTRKDGTYVAPYYRSHR